MTKLSVCLKKQHREIERLKKCRIYRFRGYGNNCILVFDQLLHAFNEEPDPIKTQEEIDSGYYKTLKDFDSYHTADIEFEGLYTGARIGRYRYKTKLNLIELGKIWRNRVSMDFPEAELSIILHQHEDEWFLDTFNYELSLESGLHL